jgi:hypothetical protein
VLANDEIARMLSPTETSRRDAQAGTFNASCFSETTKAEDPRIGQIALKFLFQRL